MDSQGSDRYSAPPSLDCTTRALSWLGKHLNPGKGQNSQKVGTAAAAPGGCFFVNLSSSCLLPLQVKVDTTPQLVPKSRGVSLFKKVPSEPSDMDFHQVLTP